MSFFSGKSVMFVQSVGVPGEGFILRKVFSPNNFALVSLFSSLTGNSREFYFQTFPSLCILKSRKECLKSFKTKQSF